MKQKIEFSLDLLLERFNQLLSLFETSQPQHLAKQLAFLVQVVCSLFSYGLPSASAKLGKKSEEEMTEV